MTVALCVCGARARACVSVSVVLKALCGGVCALLLPFTCVDPGYKF